MSGVDGVDSLGPSIGCCRVIFPLISACAVLPSFHLEMLSRVFKARASAYLATQGRAKSNPLKGSTRLPLRVPRKGSLGLTPIAGSTTRFGDASALG